MSQWIPEQYETIQWSFDEETGVGTIILDRPDSMNALSVELREDVVADAVGLIAAFVFVLSDGVTGPLATDT